jgi:hypothetical protein
MGGNECSSEPKGFVMSSVVSSSVPV